MTTEITRDDWRRIARDPDDVETRNKIVCAHLDLIERIARTILFKISDPQVELGDLISAGVIGCIAAIGRYDPSRNVDFGAFARARIAGAMRDWLRALDPVKRNDRRAIRDLERAEQRGLAAEGHAPTDEALAKATGLSIEAIAEVRRQHAVAKDFVYGRLTLSACETGSGKAVEFDAPDPSAQADADAMENVEEFEALIDGLRPRQKEVLRIKYVEGNTQAELARRLGLTPGAISQDYGRAIRFLRIKLNDHDNDHY